MGAFYTLSRLFVSSATRAAGSGGDAAGSRLPSVSLRRLGGQHERAFDKLVRPSNRSTPMDYLTYRTNSGRMVGIRKRIRRANSNADKHRHRIFPHND